MNDDNPAYSDPIYAAAHEPRKVKHERIIAHHTPDGIVYERIEREITVTRQMVYFQQQLTETGEARTRLVRRPGIREHAKLQVEDIRDEDDDPASH